MKRAWYIEKLNQVPALDIASLVRLSQAAVVDRADLTWDDRDDLTRLIAEKLLEKIRFSRSIRGERLRIGGIVSELPGRPSLQKPLPDNLY